MKLFPRIVSYLLVSVLAFPILAEGEKAAPADETPEQAVTRRKERRKVLIEAAKDIQAVVTPDPDLTVNNFSLLKNYAASGRGEFLNVSFNLVNKTNKTKEYQIYVLAGWEEDEKVAYPSRWRKGDPQIGIHLLRFQKLSPEPIDDKVVLGDKAFEERENLRYKAQINELPLRDYDNELTFEGYDHYLIKNQDKALKLKVYGDEAPPKSEQILSNIEYKKEEIDRDVNYSTEKHTYTIQSTKFNTTLTTHHYSQYREDYKFFNKVLVLIFDPTRPAAKKLVFRKLLNFDSIKQK